MSGLDEAWAEVEALVAASLGASPSIGVSLRHGEEGAYFAWAETLNGSPRLDADALGPTPAAALRELAVKLRAAIHQQDTDRAAR